MFLGSRARRWVRLTSLPPSVSRLSIKCGMLNISQSYRLPWPIKGTDLVYFLIQLNKYDKACEDGCISCGSTLTSVWGLQQYTDLVRIQIKCWVFWLVSYVWVFWNQCRYSGFKQAIRIQTFYFRFFFTDDMTCRKLTSLAWYPWGLEEVKRKVKLSL
jgi:hypothetical protein